MNTPSAAALLVVLGTACSGGATSPHDSKLRVSVQTSGGDQDNDGYTLVVGSNVHRFVFTNTTADVTIAAGTYTVALEHIADNCAVDGGNPRSVTLTPGQTVNVAFAVVCEATGILVTTRTSGSDQPDRYQLTMNSFAAGWIAANDSVVIGRLSPGSKTVSLALVSSNCSVAEGDQVIVNVSARTVTPVRFDVACGKVTRLEKIAYTVDSAVGRSFERWVGVVNLDGSGAQTLARGNSPAWSPDGKKLVFSNTECSNDFYGYLECTGGLLTLDPETGNGTTLTPAALGTSSAWSSGGVIAFVRCCDNPLAPTRFYLLDPARSAADEVTVRTATVVQAPTWSPDGQRVAFTCVIPPGNNDLCVIARDGTGLVQLTSDIASDTDAAWSPDGKRIAFTRTTGDQAAIAVLTIDSHVVSTLGEGSDPSWSRDGSRLVFVGEGGLYTINADGSNRRQLTIGRLYEPAWRP
jgi:Tol biopolymer transport system component